MAEHKGESAHSIDDAVKAAAKQVDKKEKATFKIVELGGEISPNPGTINKFTAVIELTS